MQLRDEQKQEIFNRGFIKLPGVIPQKLINIALRSINYSIGKGMNSVEMATFRSHSFCPELRNHPSVTGLLRDSNLWEAAESLLGSGNVRTTGGAQIALRFPVMQTPGELHPHLDGMYSPNNRVPRGRIQTFSMLIGVFLSNVPNRYWGNFIAWPGTHRLFEEYFRKHGVDSLREGLPKIPMPEPEQVVGETGDALICHYQLAHTVTHNVSPFVRYAVFFRLAHKDHAERGDEVLTNIWLEWPGMHDLAMLKAPVTAP